MIRPFYYVLSILFLVSCRNETIENVMQNSQFWEDLRIESESDNIEITVTNDLDEKSITFRLINSKYQYDKIEPYNYLADSLINYIYKFQELDTTFSFHLIEFFNGENSYEIEYSLSELLASLGINRMKSQDYKAALSCFNKAIRLNPDKASFYFNKAYCLFKLEQEIQSLKFLEKYINLEGDKKKYLILKARNYKSLNKKDENFKTIEQIKILYPNYETKEEDTF